MQCGAKCFVVEVDEAGKTVQHTVVARTPASARKSLRHTYGKEIRILSAVEQK